jgi:dienelactone hydrolase
MAFADQLRDAGHTVHTPDLYDGRTFEDLNEGVNYAQEVGFPEIIRRGVTEAAHLPEDIVYAGFSLGVMPAQALAQTRPGARGALFYSACIPPSEFESPWPADLPVQIHMMDADEWSDEDRVTAKDLVAEAENGELFLYPGSGHLFADSSLADYDEGAASLLTERTLGFLQRVSPT